MSMKRKRTPLTVEQKSEILQRLDRDEKAYKIAQEYNIGRATVSYIKKARPAIVKFIDQSHTSNALKRKYMKPAHDEQLDQAVFLWFSQQREKGVPVSGPTLQEKATSLHERIHPGAQQTHESNDHIVSAEQDEDDEMVVEILPTPSSSTEPDSVPFSFSSPGLLLLFLLS
ncbi:hypothetical protein ACEWY4_023712 [Coilia grayii]|uniref:HTH psq-type domain-containing protein n=1 Tax=Coilia grayii TaxID=363190 RepID=A0ABD1IYB6_9TELE